MQARISLEATQRRQAGGMAASRRL